MVTTENPGLDTCDACESVFSSDKFAWQPDPVTGVDQLLCYVCRMPDPRAVLGLRLQFLQSATERLERLLGLNAPSAVLTASWSSFERTLAQLRIAKDAIKATYRCSYCGKDYAPKKQPSEGRRGSCQAPDCIRAANRMAKARQRSGVAKRRKHQEHST